MSMKISLNTKFTEGASGGGMQFAKYLKKFLEGKNIEVVNDLTNDDIDIILHISPFTHLMSVASFSYFDAYIYKLKHPNTIIIQRINECDERKNTDYINELIIDASNYSDYLVYIAEWLKPLFEKKGMDKKIPSEIILNGADYDIFNSIDKQPWNKLGRLKIVTHHWGGNYMKGHDIYNKLDSLLENSKYTNLFEFTFIGNYPKELEYKNTKIIPPLSEKELAEELKKHHVYITASRNEPAGMHHIEGALCGLPILYINSGALPEYCNGYGIEFTEKNLEKKLKQMHQEYDIWVEKIKAYGNTSEKMNRQFYELITDLYSKRQNYEAVVKNPILDVLVVKLRYYMYLIKITLIKFKLFLSK